MKNSFDQSAEESPHNDGCSEKTCATCFENRGCIYEQYALATINKIEEAFLATRINSSAPVISKRA